MSRWRERRALRAATPVELEAFRRIRVPVLLLVGEKTTSALFLERCAERPGWPDVTITLHIRSEADGATLEALVRNTRETSPALDPIANPLPLHLSLERMQ